jgi:CxxC-x17-CxxC domain-containing protein
MNNFKSGGQRNRNEFLGGRPTSDADYGTKKRFEGKPRFESRTGNRDSRGAGRSTDRAPKEMQLYSATCTTCGKSCEVPFRPDGTKPVLCRDCFSAKNASPVSFGRDNSSRYENRAPERAAYVPRVASQMTAPTQDISALTKQVSLLQSKVDEILTLLQTKNVEVKTVSKRKPKEVVEVAA